MKFNLSLDTAIIITLMTVFLFASGQAFLGGFLRPFHIDPIILNFSIQDKIYWGFIKGLNPIAYSLLIVTIYFSVRYIDASLEIRSKIDQALIEYIRKKSTISIRHQPSIHNLSAKEDKETTIIISLITIVLIYTLFIASLFALNYLEERGEELGNNILKDVSSQPLVKIIGTINEINHYRILCGSSLCAIIDKNKNVSLVEPKNIIVLGSNFEKKKAP